MLCLQDKNTALHLAVEKESLICVALLLASGAGTSLEVKNEVKSKLCLINLPCNA